MTSCCVPQSTFVGNSIDILVMLVRDNQHMSYVVFPPLRSNKCSGEFVLIDSVLLLIIVRFFAGYKFTKWTHIIFGLVGNHVMHYT